MATVATPSPGSAREQVVLVDHDLEGLKALVAPLRGQFEFHLTMSSSDALALLDTRPIAALIAGQRLFSASGVELLTEARKRSPRTMRVLLADANERKAAAQAGLDPNAFQVLNRPCTAEQLREVLQVAAWSSTVPVEETGEIENVVLETQDEPKQAESTGEPVTVLTTDADLYEAIRAAVQNRHETYLATRLEDAVALAAEGRCPVLVTDVALAQPALERIARQISVHEPALVTVVVGGREQGNALMGLLGTGVIHRFLLKPVTSGLARLAIESAARHHAGLMTQAPPPAPTPAPAPRAVSSRPAKRPETRPAPPPPDPDLIPVVRTVAPPPPPPAPSPVPKAASPPETSRPRFAPSPVLAQEREETTFQLTAPLAAEVAETAEAALPDSRAGRFAPSSELPKGLIGAVLGVLAIIAIGVGWWWYRSNLPPPEDPTQVAIHNHLTAALNAVDEGRLVEPEGNSAFYFYSEILKIDPQNGAAVEGLERIGEHFIEQAEAMMVAGNLDGAALALAAVRLVRPDHRRLRFLDTQLRKEQRDRLMVQAGESATAGNTRRAQELLQEAEKIAPEQAAQLDFAQQVIAQRERTQLAGRSLDTARQRITQNRLVTPANDSAKFHLRAAQRADPSNVAVQQSMRDLTTRVLAEANTAVDRRQFDSARNWLREAQDLGATADQMAPIRAALEGAQVDRQKNDLLQLVMKRSEENRLLEPAQDSARHYLARLVQSDPQYPGIAQGVNTLGARLVGAAQLATTQRQYDQAAQFLTEARAIGYTGAELAAADSALRAARTPTPTAPALADVQPKRVRAAVPEYPQRALEDGTEGWVDVSFMVTAEGNVSDAKVEGALPRNMFERPALAAVRKWKFEAREPNAVYTKRIRTRVEFELNE